MGTENPFLKNDAPEEEPDFFVNFDSKKKQFQSKNNKKKLTVMSLTIGLAAGIFYVLAFWSTPRNAPLPESKKMVPPAPLVLNDSAKEEPKNDFENKRSTSDLRPIYFDSKPQGASVFLNNKEIGKTPMMENLPIGKYSFEFKMEGRKPYFKDYEVTENSNEPIVASLPKDEN